MRNEAENCSKNKKKVQSSGEQQEEDDNRESDIPISLEEHDLPESAQNQRKAKEKEKCKHE